MIKRDVVGLGAIVVDQQMILDEFPTENQKERSVDFRQQIGGPVPTALVLLQRLGHSTYFIGPWGNDSNGDAVETDLKREGVEWCQTCRHIDRATGIAHVWTTAKTGARTIVAYPTTWDGFELSAEHRLQLECCELLHLDGNGGEVAVEAAKIVKRNGGKVTLDAGAPKSATKQLIPLADVVSFPERFAEQFFGINDVRAAASEMLKLGASAVVCTQGERGAIICEHHRTTHIPAFTIDVVDTTGAGDVFCGGMIAGCLLQLQFSDAVRMGAAAAAFKCSHFGNREALPSIQQVRELLK